jgi:hypothetical protein
MNRDPQSEPKAPRSTKKAYSKPRLQIYGSLWEITRTVGKTGAKDGPAAGQKENNKTSL